MLKLFKYVVLFIVLMTALTAVYMEVNIYEGEPYYFAPHEYTSEVTDMIDAKDIYFIPFWVLLLTMVAVVLYMLFSLFIGEHSYYSGVRFVLMILLYVLSGIQLFATFQVIGDAQVLTGKTAEYIYGFVDLMLPFGKIFALMGIAEILKYFNRREASKNKNKDERFEILQEIIMKK